MSLARDEARRLRERAAELRSRARLFSPRNRKIMLAVADNYECIAAVIEQRIAEKELRRTLRNLN